ncbi:MAG: SDR family oxidoreductase [Pseudomonadota bacterium]
MSAIAETISPLMEQTLCLITGASAGLGVEFAKLAAAEGQPVVLVARRRDRLDALAESLPGEAHVYPADLIDPAAHEGLAEFVGGLGKPVGTLINNAGFGQSGRFAKADPAQLRGIVDLNIGALVDLSRRYLPGMLARRDGGILNVASTAAFQPGPLAAVYYASKAFVLSFSEALTEECRGTGVRVTALCPGPTETEFFEKADMDKVNLRKAIRSMEAAPVARAGWDGLKRGKRVVVPGAVNRLTAASASFTPRSIGLRAVKALQSRQPS